MLEPKKITEDAALEMARLGERLVAGVRDSQVEEVAGLLAPGSPAALTLEVFGLALWRLDLRLDDPREQGQLAPYALQVEPEVALLELGVVAALPTEDSGRNHLTRLFGSGLVLRAAPAAEAGWLIEDVLPVTAGSQLRPDDATDQLILETHQGHKPLPLRRERLSQVEVGFLEQMQAQPGRFNLEEQFNAVRLWRDFQGRSSLVDISYGPEWAAAVEYLITLFDYHTVEVEEVALRYGVSAEAVTDCARELAATLRVTQFDDRYSIHPDPIAHYRQLFVELGINPERDEAARLAAEGNQVFDSIEVPPDDEDFWG
jgi:hypothetical protein